MTPNGKTILVAEDDDLNRKLFRDLLEIRGYRILQTTHGAGAWELTREHHPDLVLMNISLPDVSGLDIIRRIKQDEVLRTIPIIAVTGHAMQGDAERCLAHGCAAYIPKPIDIASYIGVIETVLSAE